MSHEITMTNGTAEMAFVGATPWHGLGQRLEAGASIETWKVAAGMNWAIEQSPVEFAVKTPAGLLRPRVADKKVLYRGDNLSPLGIVGSKYAVVQPGAILEFFRDLVSEENFQLETAGTLFGGKRFWALANIGDDCEIVPGDKVGGYLLLCTAADGSMATIGKFTTVRVVCNNTLSMSLDGVNQHKAQHRSEFDAKAMKAKLGLAHAQFDTFKLHAQKAVDRVVSSMRAEELTLRLLAPANIKDLDESDKVKTLSRIANTTGYQRILSLFAGEGKGARLDGVAGTAWGWVNAVTEYVDHEKTAKTTDHRIDSAFFGKGDDLKTAALNLAITV